MKTSPSKELRTSMNSFKDDCLSSAIQGRRILVGVTGSVAAYKACILVSQLVRLGAEVEVIFTRNARKFITPLALEALTGRPTRNSLFETSGSGNHHIQLAKWAELFVIAPCTAATLARLAQGAASDLLSTEALAYRGPLLIAPAMNPSMWDHPAVVRNAQQVAQDGAILLSPEAGRMACGDIGIGRMLEPDLIVEQIALALSATPNRPQTIMVSYGSSEAAIDPVRKITNRSSGKMGLAFIWALALRGHRIIALRGPGAPLPPSHSRIRTLEFSTPAECLHQAQAHITEIDAYVSVAALLDFEPKQQSHEKIKKTPGKDTHLELMPSVDVLSELSKLRDPHVKLIGFAAESQSWDQNATAKLQAKNLDAVFVNDISGKSHAAFGHDQNAGSLHLRDGQKIELPLQNKIKIAQQILIHLGW